MTRPIVVLPIVNENALVPETHYISDNKDFCEVKIPSNMHAKLLLQDFDIITLTHNNKSSTILEQFVSQVHCYYDIRFILTGGYNHNIIRNIDMIISSKKSDTKTYIISATRMDEHRASKKATTIEPIHESTNVIILGFSQFSNEMDSHNRKTGLTIDLFYHIDNYIGYDCDDMRITTHGTGRGPVLIKNTLGEIILENKPLRHLR